MKRSTAIRLEIVLFLLAVLLFRFSFPVFAQMEGSGFIEIRSVPPGAYLQIDGVNLGTTPFKTKGLKPGTYKVTVKYQDFLQDMSLAVNPDILTSVTFWFTKESRIGFIVDDHQMQKASGASPYTPIDLELPSGPAGYIEIPQEDFDSLKMKGCQKKYNLDAFLTLTLTQKFRTSDRDVQVTLNSTLFNFDNNSVIFKKRFVQGIEFPKSPEPSDIDEMRLSALGDFLEEFNSFMIKTAPSLKGRGGFRQPIIQNIPLTPDAKLILPSGTGEEKQGKWTDKEYRDAMLRNIIDQPASPFTLKNRLNKFVNSSDYMGKQVILLYFFDASFDFCKEGLDAISKVHLENDKEFLPIGICISGKGSRRRVAENFLRARLYNFPVVFDTGEVSSKYGVNDSVPHYVLIDRGSKIRYIKRGTVNLEKLLERILYLNSGK